MRSDDEKRTIRELGFKKWFSDVFWYHYKWTLIVGLLVVAAVVSLLVLNLGVPGNDAVIMLAVSKTLPGEAVNSLKYAAAECVGDVNGDGQVVINVVQLLLNPADGMIDQTVENNASSMVTSFLQNEMVLYIFDEANLEAYAAPGSGRFNEELAAEYGGSGGAVALTADLPGAKSSEMLTAFIDAASAQDQKLYACFKEKPFTADSISDADFYSIAVTLMDGFCRGEVQP